MKKVLLTLVFAATAMVASAQFYVGGALGLEANGEDSGIDPKFGLTISPEVGYILNDKMDVGVDVVFAFQKDQDKTKNTAFGLAPYLRYNFYKFGKFGILAKASVGFLSTTAKDDAGNKTSDFRLGLGAVPQITFDMTDKVQLFANLNFAAFNLTYVSPDGGDSYTQFRVGVNTNNVANTGNFQIGFIYKL